MADETNNAPNNSATVVEPAKSMLETDKKAETTTAPAQADKNDQSRK